MASKIDIISNALILIGHKTITSLDPDQGSGAVVAALYDSTLEFLLSTTYWRFSITQQASLSKLATNPLPDDWQNVFVLPSNYITLYKTSPRSGFQIYSGALASIPNDILGSNLNEIRADYSFMPEAEVLPGYFRHVFQYQLASDFAIPVTNDRAKSEFYEKKFEKYAPIAMATDAKNHPQTPILDQPFTSVRNSQGFGSGGFF